MIQDCAAPTTHQEEPCAPNMDDCMEAVQEECPPEINFGNDHQAVCEVITPCEDA
jgi:hypothetical protein